jgi:hypothetical protein
MALLRLKQCDLGMLRQKYVVGVLLGKEEVLLF